MACDLLWFNDEEILYSSGRFETFPFLYKNNKVFLGDVRTRHSDLALKYDIDMKEYDSRFYDDKKDYIAGRLYMDIKIISFWSYPTILEFNDIIDLIENKLNIKIWNNGWKIEIYKGTNKEDFSGVFPDNFDDYLKIFSQIPIENYVGSKNQPDEIYQQHILSPMKKKKTKSFKQHQIKYKLPGEPEIVAKRRLKYLYQENLITKFKLFENPNIIFLDKKINWNNVTSFPFGYNDDVFIFGDEGETHEDIHPNDYLDGEDMWGRSLLYCGRVFYDYKVLTFWRFPENINVLKKIVKDIEIELDEMIWGKGWKIEIIKNVEDEDQKKLKLFRWGNFYNPSENTEIIPLEEYKGSKERDKKEMNIQHIVSPLKKKTKSFKQHKMKYSLPGEPEIFAKRRLKYMYQENLISKFNFF